jgi:hypothetical protein
MIKCPLCDITTGHSHFSYDIAEYDSKIKRERELAETTLTAMYDQVHEERDTLRNELDDSNRKLEQRIALEIDEHLKVVSLQEKLDNSAKDIKTMIDYVNARDGIYTWDIKDQLTEVLKRLEV